MHCLDKTSLLRLENQRASHRFRFSFCST